jgi:uncharacterized protein (TIGR02597 family)
MNSTAKFRYARLTALCASLGFASLACAQTTTVTTVPVGAMTYSFPATTSSVTTYISIPLTNPSVFTGPVASLTADTITFAGTPFTATNLAAVGSPFFARIATGAQAGRTILVKANTANSITVDTTDNSSQTTALTTSGWTVAAGDRIEIIVGDTLASLLGDSTPSNPLKFAGDTGSLSADIVNIYNKSTGKFDGYYFNTTSGFWRPLFVSQNKNDLTLYPEATLMIVRKSGRSATSLVISGDVPARAPLSKITGNNGIVQVGTGYPIDITLSQISIPNWHSDNASLLADSLLVYNPSTGKRETFFKRADNGQWNRAGAGPSDVSNLVIKAGTGLGILKRDLVSGAQSFACQAMPYTL